MTSIDNILGSPTVQRIGWMLVHSLWQGLLVGALLVIAVAVTRHRSANLRYALSCLAMLLMLALSATTYLLIHPSVAPGPVLSAAPAPALAPVPAPAAAEHAPLAVVPRQLPQAPGDVAHDAPQEAPRADAQGGKAAARVATPDASPWQDRLAQWLQPTLPWMVLSWLTGVAALSLWYLTGWWRVRRLRHLGLAAVPASADAMLAHLSARLGLRRSVRIAESALVAAPTLVGWLRPIILLPASALTGLSPEQLESILAHELAHIRRHDYLVNQLQMLAETLLFYHPVVWWVSRRIRAERENCCDDLAVKLCGRPMVYARALTAVAKLSIRSPRLAVAADGGRLLSRIRRVVGPADEAPRWTRGWPIALLLLVALLVVVPLVSSGAPARPSPNGEPATQPLDDAHAKQATTVNPAASQSSHQSGVQSALDHAVIDGVRIPYGTDIEVTGTCLKNDTNDLSCGDALLQAVRINGRANQDEIRLYLYAAQEGGKNPAEKKALAALKPDSWYRVRGHLVDGNAVAVPPKFTFRVTRFEAVDPAPAGVPDFAGREAEFEGVAEKGGVLRCGATAVHVEGVTDWPPGVIGKKVAARGVVQGDPAGWRMAQAPSTGSPSTGSGQAGQAKWHLVELGDQLGQQVSLEGRVWSLNDQWWFTYHGQALYLTDAQDHTMRLAVNNWGRRARIAGLLVRQDRPSLGQISAKTDRDLAPYFVVRRASIEYLEEPFTWIQRVRTLHATAAPISDGVLELLPEMTRQSGLVIGETGAMLYLQRNSEAVEAILRDPSPKTLDVLARRMNDAALDATLRLLYATLLCAVNDARGRDYLSAAAKDDGAGTFCDAMYYLGAFPDLLPKDAQMKTEMAWAEPVLIDVMRRKDAKGQYAAGNIAARYSGIASVLLRINSEAARGALLDYATSKAEAAEEVVRAIAQSDVPLSEVELLRLEGAAHNGFVRREVLGRFLRAQNPGAVELFLKDLETPAPAVPIPTSGFGYLDFRAHLSAPIVAALRANLARMSEKARTNARMLLLLAEEDPVPGIIKLLDDPDWKEKNLAMYELARLKDPRAIAPAARQLREAPKDYFHADGGVEAVMAVEHSLEAIANPGTKESVTELIGLFGVDLSRFGGYIDREGYRRIIAAHLIAITGESFGVDADAWRKWSQLAAAGAADKPAVAARVDLRSDLKESSLASYVGQRITVVGLYSGMGKIGPYISGGSNSGGAAVYLLGKAHQLKSADEGREVEATGVLRYQRGSYDPRHPEIAVTTQPVQENFHFDDYSVRAGLPQR